MELSLSGGSTTVLLPPLAVPLPELPPLVGKRPVPQSGSPPEAVASDPGPAASEPRVERAPAPVQSRPNLVAAPRPPQAGALPSPPADSPTLAASAAATVKKFSFPLALTAMVVVFLLVQALFDRRDPKLAAAPMTDELYVFR